MGGGSMKSNPTKARKRVAAEESSSSSPLVRGKDGSAFARCEECDKAVPVALISMHSCSLDAKIKMNLEAQVVERPPEPNKTKKPPPPASRKKSEPKAKRAKKEGKDPNAPKRPLTAFFIFLGDFRKSYAEANPDSKAAKMAAKEGGEKWKAMTEEEKKPYMDKAAELKADYLKALQADDAEEGDAETEEVAEKEEEASSDKEEEASEKEVTEVSDGE